MVQVACGQHKIDVCQHFSSRVCPVFPQELLFSVRYQQYFHPVIMKLRQLPDCGLRFLHSAVLYSRLGFIIQGIYLRDLSYHILVELVHGDDVHARKRCIALASYNTFLAVQLTVERVEVCSDYVAAEHLHQPLCIWRDIIRQLDVYSS